MENAIIAAATEYAELGGFSIDEVLQWLKDGNESVLKSIFALMEVAA